jgi:hypothetical protein
MGGDVIGTNSDKLAPRIDNYTLFIHIIYFSGNPGSCHKHLSKNVLIFIAKKKEDPRMDYVCIVCILR